MPSSQRRTESGGRVKPSLPVRRSWVRGGFPVLLISLCFYLICSGLPVVRQSILQKEELEGVQTFTPKLLQVLTAFFPDFDRLDFKNAVVSAADHPQLLHLFAGFGLSCTYTIILLWLAAIVYSKRDLQ